MRRNNAIRETNGKTLYFQVIKGSNISFWDFIKWVLDLLFVGNEGKNRREAAT